MTALLTPEKVAAALARSLGRAAERDYCVAYSGGLDSTVLLHVMKALEAGGLVRVVRAVHVDHGLHPASGEWAMHCCRQAAEWGVPLQVSKASIERVEGESVEALAREARYGLLEQTLSPEEVLLTAHQQDDQLETVILQLLRGSGVRGLSGIIACSAFGPGWHVRPLLAFERASLHDYAARNGLSALIDASNQEHRFDRNFLRHRVLPLLAARWPAASANVGRAARHCAEAAQLLDELAALDVAELPDGPLPVSLLKELSPARQRNLLRYWMKRLGLPLPSTRKLGALLHDLVYASPDAIPCVAWPGVEVHRYRNKVYFLKPLPPPSGRASQEWDLSTTFDLGRGWGSLHAEKVVGEGLSGRKIGQRLQVRFRTGGESLVLPGRREHKQLKKLFQEAGIVPWMRSRLPLLYKGDDLVAVADRWICADFAAPAGEKGIRIGWKDHPPLL